MDINLFIPVPCSKKWDSMPRTEKGKYCDKCDKVVKDFTGLNKIQTIQILANSKEKNICANVNAQILYKNPKKTNRISAFSKSSIKIILLFILIIYNKIAFAQQANFNESNNPNEKKSFGNKKFTLNIKAKNEKGEPISFAVITIKGNNNIKTSTICDSLGNTSIKLNEADLSGNIISITVLCMGYETKTTNYIYLLKETTTMEIILKECPFELNEFKIVSNTILTEHAITNGCTFNRMGNIVIYTSANYKEDIGDTNSQQLPVKTELCFKTYPSPTDGIFTIESNIPSFFDLQIFDNMGKMLSTHFQNQNNISINLTGNAPGIYFANIMENGQIIETKKIILKEGQ